jgi:hypothetical protein
MRTKTFSIFCNRITGEKKKALDFKDLLENKMLKRQKEHWSSIKFKDEHERTISIDREFLESGMTFEDAVWDWLGNSTEEEQSDDIFTI